MRKEDTIRLNTHVVLRRVEVLGLKQWWLAQMIGVSAKTVGRWLSGKVERIGRENAARLAAHLECPLEDLVISDEADIHATREQQRRAAELIQQRDLLALLSPTDNWHLAESLIKATLEPNLPLHRLGMLYNLLSITAWRQGHYDEGLAHAERALEIGGKCRDRGVVHKATCNIATIRSITGPHLEALAAFEEVLRHPDCFDTPRDHASAFSNISGVYAEFARFEECLRAQREAIAIFERLALPFNLAISWTTMACVLTELGRFDQALDAVECGARHAAECGYDRGTATLTLCRADILSLRGHHDTALRLAEQGIARLAAYDVYYLGCNEIAVRVERRAGLLDAAHARMDTAEAIAEPFPVLFAMHKQERSRLAAAVGDMPGARRAAAAANRTFRACGMDARVCEAPLPEYGTMFAGASPVPAHTERRVRQKIRTFSVPVVEEGR